MLIRTYTGRIRYLYAPIPALRGPYTELYRPRTIHMRTYTGFIRPYTVPIPLLSGPTSSLYRPLYRPYRTEAEPSRGQAEPSRSKADPEPSRAEAKRSRSRAEPNPSRPQAQRSRTQAKKGRTGGSRIFSYIFLFFQLTFIAGRGGKTVTLVPPPYGRDNFVFGLIWAVVFL